MIYSMKRKEKRENLFKWVGKIVNHETHFLALKSSPIQPTNNLEEIKKYEIGAVIGGATAKSIEADGFPEVETVPNQRQNWYKLNKGRIDLWCTNFLSARHTIESTGDDPNKIKIIHLYEKRSQKALYMAFSKQTNDSIVEKFRKGYKRIKDKGIYGKILKKYSVPH